MRKTYLITLLLCCFSALLNGAVSPFSFSSLKMEEGLSQLSVLKIHQDKRAENPEPPVLARSGG